MNIEISSKGFFANLELPNTTPPHVASELAADVVDVIVRTSHLMDIAPCDTAVNENNGEQGPPC